LRDVAADVTVAYDHRAEPRLSSSIYGRRCAVGRAEQLARRSANVNGIERPDADPEWRQRFERVAGFDADADRDRHVVIESDRIAVHVADDSPDRNVERDCNAHAVRVAKSDRATDGCAERNAAGLVRDGYAAERNHGLIVQLDADLRF
jgi:hypothetical protein